MRKKHTEKEQKRRIQAVIHYKAATAIFKLWLDRGYINPEDYACIDDMTAAKYKLPPNSIYRRVSRKKAYISTPVV